MLAVTKAFFTQNLRVGYITLVGLIGVGLLLLSVASPILTPDAPPPSVFLTLSLLGIAAQFFVYYGQSNFTLEVGTIIALATGAIYNVHAAIIIVALSFIALEIKNLHRMKRSWKKFARVLGFNFGMFAIATYAAVQTYTVLSDRIDTVAWQMLCWLTAGIVFEQVNWILLSVLLATQSEQNTSKDTSRRRWDALLSTSLMSMGSGLFASTVMLLGVLGVFVFALPLLMMMLTIRLHMRETEQQRQILENLVDERTHELQVTNHKLSMSTSELQIANRDLKDVIAQKDRFLSILSHDMKTPLTTIRLYGQMLQRGKALTDARRNKIAQSILTSENTLTELVVNILDIEKLKTGEELEIIKEPFDMAEIGDVAMLTLAAHAEHKKIDLTLERPEHAVCMFGDKIKLQRVLLNLLSNAVKYTPNGGQVSVALVEHADTCVITVCDTGYGIPSKDLDKIFMPYHRVAENNRYAVGTGLGLSVVKHMVEAHGGTIGVESQVAVGSTFTVELPLGIEREGDETMDRMTIAVKKEGDVNVATTAQPDSQSSSPRPQQSESPEPTQRHTTEPSDASRS